MIAIPLSSRTSPPGGKTNSIFGSLPVESRASELGSDASIQRLKPNPMTIAATSSDRGSQELPRKLTPKRWTRCRR